MEIPEKKVTEQNENQETKQFRICVYFRKNRESDAAALFDYYNHMLKEKENWMVVDMVCEDKNSNVRFREIIQKAKEEQYDFIITPSFSNFATRIIDAFNTVKELISLNPPVGILFEIDGIYTLEAGSTDKLEVEMFVALHAHEQNEREKRWYTKVRGRKYENGSI